MNRTMDSKTLLIIGWNEGSKNIIYKLNSKYPHLLMCLIDNTLNTNPINEGIIHFIKGSSLYRETLIQANIFNADHILITSNHHKNERNADKETILSLLTIKCLNPNAHCIVEILTDEQFNNAKRAGADEIICSNILSAASNLHRFSNEKNKLNLLEILSNDENVINCIKIPNNHINKTYSQYFKEVIEEGKVPLGITQGDHLSLNHYSKLKIQSGDNLVFIERID
ncbi:Trk K+ transport system NAD-binding subunit [Bacillus pakistanensis]|uniref:Trk K+ transport system NAD-binding subunit n=1 Tax=Rossellomorea pakistanensis TaxID=992288 RepID=A0ABS2ND52_9BACI|nr:NAD-binding protein [Bacillus pakistanensis]MBM7585679.1 Trk K+ transport system NAD-binding subunit [Bacillus pakistanensis]